MTVITKSEFAARRGWSKSYVSKLVSQGRLVLTEDDKVELEATEALLLETADPSKVAVAKRHDRLRLQREAQTCREEPAVPPTEQPADFQKSRALREHYLSLQERTNFLKQQGSLVELDAVKTAAFTAGRMLRDQLLGMPPQLAPQLAALNDPWQIERHLTSAIRQALDDAERLSIADLNHALTPELTMHTENPDGAGVYREAYFRGLRPDPDLWVDEWADEYMRIPRDTGAAEPGQYRTSRTPYAQEPMRCLSPAHPCKRVVTMVASQLMKTQIALNWIGGLIHMAPSNILTLLPSLGLAKRVSSRISKTIKATPILRERVASSRSRDARNTMDTKEFEGGSLYVTTAGSAANLSELSARYVYGDEVDRWEVDVGEEGDPIELAETRGSTFGRNAKFYFSSSPTIKGASRITDLFESSDQRFFYVPCPTCGHMQVLEWERLHYSDDYRVVHYQCADPDCDLLIEEHHKGEMLARGQWRAHAEGDGETVGFHLNALYSPPGWLDWRSLAKQFEKAKKAKAKGDLEPMQVFYNTRLARVWDSAQEQTKASVLVARARLELYTLGTMPAAVLMLTGAVDVQANRLELMVTGFGVGMERWIVDHQVIWGDPADERTWAVLDEKLKARYRHPCGVGLTILATGVDSGGHHTDEVYQFCRMRRWRNVFAIKGASKPGRPVIAQRPSMVDVTWKGQTERNGAELWFVGTDTAKDWIYNRYPFESGAGALHFANDLPDEFFDQCVAERKVARYVRGHKRIEWVKGKAERNEALDLMVYCLAMAHYLGINRYQENDWERVRQAMAQSGLFDTDADAGAVNESASLQVEIQPPAVPADQVTSSRPLERRRTSHSGYLKRR